MKTARLTIDGSSVISEFKERRKHRRDHLVDLWNRACRNPLLCAESRSHIEYVLGMEYRMVTA